MLTSIKRMLSAFEEYGIKYCHWKSNEHLDQALNGDTDLDVLFTPEQRMLLDKVLSECGLKRFRSTPLMQYNAIEDFIGFDFESGKIWHLHTHYRMTLGESHLKGYTITPWNKLLLENRIYDDCGIYISDPNDELILLLCRIALKLRLRDISRNLGNDDIFELKWLKERINYIELKKRAMLFIGNEAANIILKMSKEKLYKKSQFRELQSQLEKDFCLFTGYNRFSSRITRTIRELFWLYGGVMRRLKLNNLAASRRVSPSGGCVVSLLGCDGAGKSTTLEYVRKEFNKKIDVATIYFGSGDGSSSLIRKPMKMVAKKVGGKGLGHTVEKEYKENKKISMKSRLYSCAKILWAIALANEKKSKFKQMAKARNNGLLVLTDRYPQTVMPGCSDGPLLNKYIHSGGILQKIAEWEKSIYEMGAVNPPDLMIKLLVPTELAISRKPEMTVEEIEKKKTIVMSIDYACSMVTISTDRPFEITRSEVMKAIWEIL